MFYDLDDPGKFLDDVKQVLAPDGLFVIEQNYLPRMLEDNRVDNISAEHLCYYSISTLSLLLWKHGFGIEDLVFDEINGGVFRCYVRHMKEYEKSQIPERAYELIKDWPEKIAGIKQSNNVVENFLAEFQNLHLDKLETYKAFIDRVQKNAKRLHHFIERTEKTVDAYAASTRGLTLMQLADLNEKLIRKAVERNPAKWGKLYNGIPVVSEEEMRKDPPDYLLILAQGFLPEFIQREWNFLKNGGKFILPFDRPRILAISDL